MMTSEQTDDRPLSFGVWVGQRRRTLRLTQHELAERVGCSRELIRKIETDARRPSREVARLLASHLDVLPEERDAFVHCARGELAPDHLSNPSHVPRSELLPAAGSAPRVRGNLPAQLSSFLGREHELAALQQLLQNATIRLVTLTGAGGSGKTRLAMRIAEMLRPDYPDGAWFVNLAPLNDPQVVPSAIVQSFALPDLPDRSPRERLLSWLPTRRLLLILDNYEHLIASAPLVTEILRSAPFVRVVATSRVPLRVTGEHEYPVLPLDLPLTPTDLAIARGVEVSQQDIAMDDLSRSESIRLFVERARAIKPGLIVTPQNAWTIATICIRLAGLPLAIELAAARVRMLSLDALLTRLNESLLPTLIGGPRDMPTRQQTIRATIEWSCQLLTTDQLVLLSRLGVCVGGWTIDAAEAIGSDLPAAFSAGSRARCGQEETLAALEHLVAHSLVQIDDSQDPPRYTMLATIREYAIEQLQAWGQEDVQRTRHARYYCDLVVREEPALWSPRQIELLNCYDVELGNLRTAFEWLLASNHTDEAALLVTALADYWIIRSYFGDAISWLEAVLQRETLSVGLRAKALLTLGCVYREVEQFTVARRNCQESLALYHALEDRRGMARAGAALGLALVWPSPDPTQLAPLLEETLTIARAIGDRRSEADALSWLGWLELAYQRFDTARALLMDSHRIRQESRVPMSIVWDLDIRYDLESAEGNYHQARVLREETLRLLTDLRSPRGIAIALENLKMVSDPLYDFERSQVYSREQLAVSVAAGLTVPAVRAYAAIAGCAMLLGQNETALQYAADGLAFARATCITPEELSRGEILIFCARVLLAVGRLDEAERINAEALENDRLLGEQSNIAINLRVQGDIYLARGWHAQAQAAYAEAIVIAERIGRAKWVASNYRLLGLVAVRSGDVLRAAGLLREALQRWPGTIPLDEQASFADAWAEMALAQGHAAIAVQLWSRMAMILAEISIQLAPVRRIYRDAQLERARDLLGSAAFDAAWDAGRALTWAQIRAMVEDGSPHDWSAPMYRTTDDGRSAAAS